MKALVKFLFNSLKVPMDVVMLSRMQFGFTIAFHYLFPPLSIGLALMLVIMEGMYIRTGKEIYKKMTKFWTKIFALSFAMGVATGIVMVFAFGNNWAKYSRFVGDVFGSALAAEGIFAFFLEAGFLGLMLFGWNRVSKKIHYLSTVLVALGAHFSAIWITIANSWMQTPAGYKIIGEKDQARAVISNYVEMLLNHSSIERIVHVIIGCWLTGAFIVLSISAYYMLRNRDHEFAKKSMKLGLIVGAICIILQGISADDTARGVAKNQPEKLAAIEGLFETRPSTPFALIGHPDVKTKTFKGIKVPSLLSLLVYRNTTSAVIGLDQFKQEDWPNVPLVFHTYHVMIACWMLMFIAVAFGCLFYFKKKIEKAKATLIFLVVSVLWPYIANQAGWYTAEFGRQPWIVYRVMRTYEGVSKSITAGQVLGSLIMFVVIYSLLFGLFIFLLNQKIQHGPEDEEADDLYTKVPFNKQGSL